MGESGPCLPPELPQGRGRRPRGGGGRPGGPAGLRRSAHAEEPRRGASSRSPSSGSRRRSSSRDDRQPDLRRDLPPVRAPVHPGRAVRRRPDAGGGLHGRRGGQDLDDPAPARRAVPNGKECPPRTWSRPSRGGADAPSARPCSRTSSPSGQGPLHGRAPVRRLRGHRPAALGNANQFPAIYPKEVVEAAGDGQIKDFVGTGPFRFVERIPDRYTRMARFDRTPRGPTPHRLRRPAYRVRGRDPVHPGSRRLGPGRRRGVGRVPLQRLDLSRQLRAAEPQPPARRDDRQAQRVGQRDLQQEAGPVHLKALRQAFVAASTWNRS